VDRRIDSDAGTHVERVSGPEGGFATRLALRRIETRFQIRPFNRCKALQGSRRRLALLSNRGRGRSVGCDNRGMTDARAGCRGDSKTQND